MAIVQQDPRLQQNEEEQVQTGAITGTQGAPRQELGTPTQELAPQAPQPPAQGAQAQPSPQQAQQPPQVTQRRSEAPRSGMATNVQQYVEKNVPQAQRIAGAATQDIRQQTGQIAQQAEQRQKEFQQQIQQQQQKLEEAQQFAQQQIQNILQQPIQEGQEITPTQEEAQRFQQLTRGELGVQAPDQLSLAAEHQRLQALQQLAGGVRTEAGRRAALQGVFGERGPYTAGQASLDELILAGSPEGRQALIEQSQQAYTGTEQQLRTAEQQAREAAQAQRELITGLPAEIQALQQEALGGITGDVESRLATQQKLREELAPQLGAAAAEREQRLNFLKSVYDPTLPAERADFYIMSMLETGRPNYWTESWLKHMLGVGTSKRDIGEFIEQARLTPRDLELLGFQAGDSPRYGKIAQAVDELSPTAFSQELAERGYTLDQILDGRDISAATVASPEQISRANALAALAGQAPIYAPEQVGEYLSVEDINNLLEQYSVSQVSQPTGPRRPAI